KIMLERCGRTLRRSPGGPASAEQPGLLGFAFGLERLDLLRMRKRQADLIQTVEQTMLVERIDRESKAAPRRCHDDLLVEVHRELISRSRVDFAEELIHR